MNAPSSSGTHYHNYYHHHHNNHSNPFFIILFGKQLLSNIQNEKIQRLSPHHLKLIEWTKTSGHETNIFGLKMKHGNFLILKFYQPLQKYLLTCQANSVFLGRFFALKNQKINIQQSFNIRQISSCRMTCQRHQPYDRVLVYLKNFLKYFYILDHCDTADDDN